MASSSWSLRTRLRGSGGPVVVPLTGSFFSFVPHVGRVGGHLVTILHTLWVMLPAWGLLLESICIPTGWPLKAILTTLLVPMVRSVPVIPLPTRTWFVLVILPVMAWCPTRWEIPRHPLRCTGATFPSLVKKLLYSA